MAYVADSVDIDPPPEQLGLHPGAFTIDWDDAMVTRQEGSVTVNASISPTNHYVGTFWVDPTNESYGTYRTAMFQRLTMSMGAGASSHGAYVATVIPDQAHATMDAGAIGRAFYSGDLTNGFSGRVMYSLPGSNITVLVETLERGSYAGRISLFEPTDAGYWGDLSGMGKLLGMRSAVKGGAPVTRSDDPPEPGGDSPFNDFILTDAGSDDGTLDGGALDGATVVSSRPPGASGTGSSFDVMNPPKFHGTEAPPRVPPADDGIGAAPKPESTSNRLSQYKADSIAEAVIDSLIESCGFRAALNDIGGFSKLTGGLNEDTKILAGAQYNVSRKAIIFKDASASFLTADMGTYEEVSHYIQDNTYRNGDIGDYAGYGDKCGSANVEMEAKVMVDLYFLGKYGEFFPNQSLVLVNCKDQSIVYSYRYFLTNIQTGVFQTTADLNSAFDQMLRSLVGADGITWLNGNTIAEAGTLPPEVLDLYGELLASKDCHDMPKPPCKIPAGVTPVPNTSKPVSNGGKTTVAAGGGSKAGRGQATAIR